MRAEVTRGRMSRREGDLWLSISLCADLREARDSGLKGGHTSFSRSLRMLWTPLLDWRERFGLKE